MIHWRIGNVLEIVRFGGKNTYQEITVQLEHETEEGGGDSPSPSLSNAKAIHYTDTLPQVEVGDRVLLNTTAVDLQLGTGGYHFVYAVLNRVEEIPLSHREHKPQDGHMIKLRYTPQQRSVLAAEEQASPYHNMFTKQQSLDGIPVLIGELHSMLPIVLSWLHYLQLNQENNDDGTRPMGLSPRVVYIMSDGGALPLSFSNHVCTLRELGWLHGTITYGQAYGGELETMNKFTALIAARHIMQADIVIVTMGPGIAGTGTLLGHSGIEVGELVNAVGLLAGLPIVIPRISFADSRERHQGLSHHTLTSLFSIAMKSAILPLPLDMEPSYKSVLEQQLHSYKRNTEDLSQFQPQSKPHQHHVEWIQGISIEAVRESLDLYRAPITSMGRGIDEDVCFFQGVCAAAQFAWDSLNSLKN